MKQALKHANGSAGNGNGNGDAQRRRLSDFLSAEGLVTSDQLAQALTEQ